MTIKQQGGIFGRHPVFADVEAETARLNQITEETANAGVTIEGVLLKDKNLDVASNANQLTISPSDRATYGRLDIGHFTNGVFIGTYAGANTASDVIRLGTSGTEHLRLEGGNVKVNTGNLVIGTSGKGIDFSATAGTGTSELFDDYEEGTWTPVLGSDAGESGQTYTEQNGFYQKIGNTVYFQFRVQLSAKGTVNLEASLKGFPYAVSYVSAFGSGVVTDFRGLAGSYVHLGLMPDPNQAKMYFRTTTAAATDTGFAQANSLYTDTTLMQGFGSYISA